MSTSTPFVCSHFSPVLCHRGCKIFPVMQLIQGECWGGVSELWDPTSACAGHQFSSWVSRRMDPGTVPHGSPRYQGGTKAVFGCATSSAGLSWPIAGRDLPVELRWHQPSLQLLLQWPLGCVLPPRPVNVPVVAVLGSLLERSLEMETSRMQKSRRGVPQHQPRWPLQ